LRRLKWPDGKRFAFPVLDDSDFSNIENGPPVYEFLYNKGFSITKSVWPLRGRLKPKVGGSTCEDPDYLTWVRKLRGLGFEIALHNVTYHTSKREQVIKGLEHFKVYFGSYPKTHSNHTGCYDSIYWGDARLDGINKLLYKLLTGFKNSNKFKGHLEDSELFWGDICKQKIKYVRNFVCPEINTLKFCPFMPYFDEKRPYVNYWFASSEGANVSQFNKTISEENQDRLEDEGGICIMYTHFGADFFQDGRLNIRFKQLMERLSRKPGWFVPVSTLLDYILNTRGHYSISSAERFKLELKWIIRKIRMGGTT
jgi:hypothetical protein